MSKKQILVQENVIRISDDVDSRIVRKRVAVIEMNEYEQTVVCKSSWVRSDNSNYDVTLDRFSKLVSFYNKNAYMRKIIEQHLDVLDCGVEKGEVYSRIGLSFDMLDICHNKLQKASDVLGAIRVNRTSDAPHPSTQYTVETHLKGKYAGHTKCYIPARLLIRNNIAVHNGKYSHSIFDDYRYLSLYDVLNLKYCAIGHTVRTSNTTRYLLNNTRGCKVVYNGTFYRDCTYANVLKLGLKLQCNSCGSHTDKVNHKGICVQCSRDNLSYEIMDYSEKPQARFIRNVRGKLKAFYRERAKFNLYNYKGIELEVELRQGVSDAYKDVMIDEISRIKTVDGTEIFYVKRDGSLNYGFEIVSHPMTTNAWRNFDFAGFIYKHRAYIKSFNTNTAGMHIHVSRNALGSYDAFKMLRMTYDFPAFSMLISQRNASEHNEWASLQKSQLDNMKRIMVEYYRDGDYNPTPYNQENTKVVKATGGHRGAWNFGNSATIECRLFKGQMKPEMFYKNIEYVDSIIDFAKVTSMDELKLHRYVGFVKSNYSEYPNLNRYLNRVKKQLQGILEHPTQIPSGLNV